MDYLQLAIENWWRQTDGFWFIQLIDYGSAIQYNKNNCYYCPVHIPINNTICYLTCHVDVPNHNNIFSPPFIVLMLFTRLFDIWHLSVTVQLLCRLCRFFITICSYCDV